MTILKISLEETVAYYNSHEQKHTHFNNFQTRNCYLDTGPAWITNGTLNEEGKNTFFTFLYGHDWKNGTETNPQTVIKNFQAELLNEDESLDPTLKLYKTPEVSQKVIDNQYFRIMHGL